MRRSGFLASFLLTLLLWSSTFSAYAADGKALFKGNCGSCHAVNKKVVGPALKGVHDRWENNEEEMAAFIKASQAYMKAGRKFSAYTTQLFNEYNQSIMPNQALKDDEITAILAYIKEEGAKPDPATAAAPAGDGTGAGGGLTFSENAVYTGLLVLVGVLGLITFILLVVIGVLVNAIRAKNNKQVFTLKESVLGLAKNKFIITIAVLVAAAGGANELVTQARGVGLHKGYGPVQPIAFSHKLHAGQYGINCNYCHVGAERGKSATIPSTNICMNCHNYIQQGPQYGEKEIGKILASWKEGKPIEWVRIHNLPDFVYFNHAQHTKVGGLECQTCHGQIQEMEVVYQHSDLSMGWCINCHREKKVDLNKNNYYRTVHAELIAGKEDSATVEQLGGLSCARCHY